KVLSGQAVIHVKSTAGFNMSEFHQPPVRRAEPPIERSWLGQRPAPTEELGQRPDMTERLGQRLAATEGLAATGAQPVGMVPDEHRADTVGADGDPPIRHALAIAERDQLPSDSPFQADATTSRPS